jgi:hypothetical protein
MRVVTWNMAFWSHGRHHERAWRWVFDELRPDVFLCQEADPPDWVGRDKTVIWERAYPAGQQTWGTGLVTGLPCSPARLPGLDSWFEALPKSLPGESSLAGIHRADGWLASGHVDLPGLGKTLVASVHSPSFPVEPLRLGGIDVSGMKLQRNPNLWFTDILFYFMRAQLGQRLLVGGDFNASRLLDQTLGERGNNEFFDRIQDEGFVSIHRRFHTADERTYFKDGKSEHQLDYLYADAPLAGLATACVVHPHAGVAEFSDHAPVIADFRPQDTDGTFPLTHLR